MPYERYDHGTTGVDPEHPLRKGQVVGGRYAIGSIIGEGGMGVVYAATHLGLDVPVALKLIRPDLKNDPEFSHRFLNEARSAAALKSEHIARVHDVGQLATGEPYIVMERLEGIGLEAFIERRAPLSQTDAADLVMQVCEGLAEAHALSMVHRDVKPANLFLARHPDGRQVLKILDFGISKRLLVRGRKTLTDPAKSLGSPWYMSPEQMKDASRVDQRADIWSLGILLFELLTRQHPFDGTVVPEVCAKVLTEPAPRLRTLCPEIDPGLEAVVERCLEKDPERRYAGVAALMQDLAPYTSRLTPVRDRDTPGSLAPTARQLRLGRRKRGNALPASAALLALAVLGWLGFEHAPPTLGAELRTRLDALHLPWDPVLASTAQQGEPLDRPFEPPALIVRISSETRPVAPRRLAAAEAPLTPEEIRFRTERYERWLRNQGLTRLEDVGDVSPFGNPTAPEAGPPPPADVTRP